MTSNTPIESDEHGRMFTYYHGTNGNISDILERGLRSGADGYVYVSLRQDFAMKYGRTLLTIRLPYELERNPFSPTTNGECRSTTGIDATHIVSVTLTKEQLIECLPKPPAVQGDDWIDKAISFNVNRGLIHEDRWTDLKQAIRDHIAANYVPKGELTELDKAYGGCHNCYGKGYATGNEFASGRGAKWRVSNMRYCTCERGKQLQAQVDEAVLSGKIEELKHMEHDYKEYHPYGNNSPYSLQKCVPEAYMKGRIRFLEEQLTTQPKPKEGDSEA